MNPYLRLIGDAHGNYEDYLTLASGAEHSIQLGDLGFDYHCLKALDPEKHKVLGGNHDNYEEKDGKFVKQTAHFLGDFGVHTVPDFGPIFFVRGGHSIDWKYRVLGVDFFEAEQLSQARMTEAIEMYCDLKPDFVISHECPSSLISSISRRTHWDGIEILPSMTSRMLDMMWNNHQPKFHYFGHHHVDKELELRGTQFRCLAELSYVDLARKE